MKGMNLRKCSLLLVDTLIIIAACLSVAVMGQLDINSLTVNGEFTLVKFLIIFVLLSAVRFAFQVHKPVWRYATVRTYLRLSLADIVAGVIYLLVGVLAPDYSIGFGCGLIFFMGNLLLTLFSRFIYQVNYAYRARSADKSQNKIKIAIVGAGNVGAILAEELIRNPKAHYIPVCFIDKDPQKAGNSICGLPVYQGDESIIQKIETMPVQEIVIAIPDADKEEKARLYELYKKTGCKVKIYDYPFSAKASENHGRRSLREFQIEDLLFRDTIKVKSKRTSEFYTGKTVLVTGGGGSIGSELCRQIARHAPKKLVIVDIYENNAYDIQQELIRKYGDKLSLEVYIASVRDMQRMEQIFRSVKPELVFHAAAHKHVPLMQVSGCEAIKNNVMGTYNVANLAEKYGAEKFLLISTDKAVNPTNIMGASKRMCEMVIQCRQNSRTEFTAVRFGNVLGSNGSVIPLFRRQIEAGGPITLTDKRIIRYFMTIPEAVGLVMETCCMAHNGELFVLDMGKPVKILDLAENMIKMSGLTPYEDIDIIEIGLRPGEKLYEELLMKTEDLDKTDNDLIFIERDKGLTRDEVDEKLRILMDAVNNETSILDAVRLTVPTYHDPEELNRKAAESEEMKNVKQPAAV